MVLSGSLALLEVLISVVCREKRHAQEDQIQSSLRDFLTRFAESKNVHLSHKI